MNVFPLRAFRDNYIWMILDPEEQTCLCVDPGQAEPVLTYLSSTNYCLKGILLTHHHADHVGGVLELLNTYSNTPVYGPMDKRIPGLSHPLSDQKLAIESYTFHLIYTPGHTTSHLCFYEPSHAWLFCGDTLFSAGCGRAFEGSYEELYDALNRLNSLPSNTLVFAAHEYTLQNLRFAALVEPNNQNIQTYISTLEKSPNTCSLPSTLKKENEINPFLRLDKPDVRQYAIQHHVNPDDKLAVFRLLRKEKDTF